MPPDHYKITLIKELLEQNKHYLIEKTQFYKQIKEIIEMEE